MDADAADMAAARRGDSAAFARLYDRHAPVVISLCRRHQRSQADAEDALQETFFRAWMLLDDAVAPGAIRSWLYGIAWRVCSERRRADARRDRREETAMLNHVMCGSQEPGAVELAAREERRRRLNEAIDALPDEERLALHLYYLEPDPVAAASSALGLSRSGFYKMLARARERLAAHMGEMVTP
jgi:RNA polymerase sigma-70 factor (ECF subfamily)